MNLEITHILSTDRIRPIDEIIKDIEKNERGITVVNTLDGIGVINLNIPDTLPIAFIQQYFYGIDGVVAVGPNHPVRAI